MLEETKLNIGTINLSVFFNAPQMKFSLNGYRRFLSNNTGNNMDIKIDIYSGKLPRFRIDKRRLIFKNGNFWELYQFDKIKVFALRYPEFIISHLNKINPDGQKTPYYKIIIANHNFSEISVYLKEGHKVFNKYREKFELKNRIRGSIEDILRVLIESHISLNKKGLLFHSAGIVDRDNGYLFIGSSGKGKTTLSYIFQKANATILNDDKIMVYPQDGSFWLAGTPWHGRNYNCCSLRAPLKKIFFIEHGQRNIILPNKIRTITPQLLKHSHFPLWDASATRNAVDLCSNIARKVPIGQLYFLPDNRVVNFIRDNVGQ